MSQPYLYNMVSLDDDCNVLKKSYDSLFLAAASDYRAYEILRKLRRMNVELHEVLIFNFSERNASEEKEAYYRYKEIGYMVKIIDCSIMDPSACFKLLSRTNYIFHKYKNICIDITCFTKPYFFYIIKYFKERVGLKSVTVFYTEPANYLFNKGLYQSYHSTSGSLEVIELEGFSGDDTSTEEKILVILLGFDGELSKFISEEIDVKDIYLVNGFPAYTPIFKDVSIINNEKLVTSEKVNELLYVSADNPFETFNLLERIKTQRPKAYFNVAALGTKPMALGTCLFATLNPFVRVLYPLPVKYADVTTNECCQSWLFTIPLML